jgi:succinate-semialdehyde dehydrogenase/glutarate-semialdehyde dehydrogenase
MAIVTVSMRSLNPATAEVIRDYPELAPAELERVLDGVRAVFDGWRTRPVAERAALLGQAAGVLRAGRAEYASLMTEEVGKPVAAAEAEIDKCAWVCDYYAEHAARFLSPEPVATEAKRSFVRFDPLGAVFAIMPWNFPFWQVFRFAAPALAGGNVGLLKHAANVPGCALAIERVFREAGFPDGVFRSLLIGSELASRVIAHRSVAAVTLTGSDRAGRAVAMAAGEHLKKVVLELGGSDPFIVLADADVERAAQTAVESRVVNSGQSCIAAKRFIVEEPIADAFEGAFTRQLQALRVGDPRDRATQVGPLVRQDLVDTLHAQVTESVAQGARLLAGGQRLPGPGFYYAPTALAGVAPGMPVFDDETFGPVAAISRAANADEAISLANRSKYGLGASLWTMDLARAEALAARLEAGLVFVNSLVKSDPRLPFGGVKESGHGRELGSYGLREFLNIKTVWME